MSYRVRILKYIKMHQKYVYYVLYLMSFNLCNMSYVLCLIIVVFFMSYVLFVMSYVLCLLSYVFCFMFYVSDQRIVIFPANRNRNRFAEPTSVRIGIGIVRESQNLRIGIGIIFVRWELFANYSRISEIFFLSYFILIISFS